MGLVDKLKEIGRAALWAVTPILAGCAYEQPKVSHQDILASLTYNQQNDIYKQFVSRDDFIEFSRAERLERIIERQYNKDKFREYVEQADKEYLHRFMDEFEELDVNFERVFEFFNDNNVDIDRVLDILDKYTTESSKDLSKLDKQYELKSKLLNAASLTIAGLSDDEIDNFLSIQDNYGTNLTLNSVSALVSSGLTIDDINFYLTQKDFDGNSLKANDLWGFYVFNKPTPEAFSEYLRVLPVEVVKKLNFKNITPGLAEIISKYSMLKKPDGTRVFDFAKGSLDTLFLLAELEIEGYNKFETIRPFIYEIGNGRWTTLEESNTQITSGLSIHSIPEIKKSLLEGKSITQSIFNSIFGDYSEFSNDGKPKALVTLPTTDFNGAFTNILNQSFYTSLMEQFDVRYVFTDGEQDLYQGLESCKSLDDLAIVFIGGHGSGNSLQLSKQKHSYDDSAELGYLDSEIKQYLLDLKSKPVLVALACSCGQDVESGILSTPSIARFLHELTGYETYGSKTPFAPKDIKVIPGEKPRVIIGTEENTAYFH